MTDKEIVQEITGRICSCHYVDFVIHMFIIKYKTDPVGLKKIIGGKLFNEIKFRYNRK